jgi:hypothetical protein
VRTDERGSAAIEFALVLPLLLVVGLALLQVGLVIRDRLLVEAAARAGAREAAVSESAGDVREAAARAGVGLDAGALSVGVERQGGRGDPVTVTVRYQERLRVPFIQWLVGSSVAMSTHATDRQEFG